MSILLLGCVFLTYYSTLQPSIGDSGDSAKFQLIAQDLGIPHATGYPLFTLLSHIFTYLPFRDVAFRVNLLSTFAAVGAVFLLYHIVCDLTKNRLSSLVSALLFAFSQTFWSQAVIAEVYTLHVALMGLTSYFLFKWQKFRDARWYFGALSIYTLSLGNHASTILWAPALFCFIWTSDYKIMQRIRYLVFGAFIMFLGLGQYAWLYFRARQHPFFCEYCPDTLSKLWWYLRGAQFQSRFFAFSFVEAIRRISRYPNLVLDEFGWFVGIMSVIGAILLARSRHARKFTLFSLSLLINVVFALNYNIGDYIYYLIPSYFIIMIFAGFAMANFCDLIFNVCGPRGCWRGQNLWPALWCIFLILLPVRAFHLKYPVLDQSNNVYARKKSEAILNVVPENSILVEPPCCDFYNRAMAVLYMQGVESLRTDVSLYRFSENKDGLVYRPPYLTQGLYRLALLETKDSRAAFLPQVGQRTKSILEKYFYLRPVDTSRVSLIDWLDYVPEQSIVILASRQPVRWSLDENLANAVNEKLKDFGFGEIQWGLFRSQILVGVKGAPLESALHIVGENESVLTLKKDENIGTSGTNIPVSLRIISSGSNLPIVIDGENISNHHWGYQIVVLDESSGEVLRSANFDTETFLVNNTRVYRIAAVRRDDELDRLDVEAWFPSDGALDFSLFGSRWFLDEGWSSQESWGAWGIGSYSSARFGLPDSKDYEMLIHAFPYCPDSGASQAMRVLWNGRRLDTVEFEACELQTFSITVPRNFLSHNDINEITFHYRYAQSPYEVSGGIDGDRRPLAVGFTKIEFIDW